MSKRRDKKNFYYITYKKVNPGYVSYGQLKNTIKPGFYVRIKRGGHSTIFIHWSGSGEDPVFGMYKTFDAIGGNQVNGHVAISSFTISPERVTHILWKATREACCCRGIFDGFGDTSIRQPVGIKSIKPIGLENNE